MTRFEIDKQNTFMYGDSNSKSRPMTRAYWNLVVSIRDVGLFIKGIKPNRHWRLKDVKEYFGVKGNKESIYDQLLNMLDEYKIELGIYDESQLN
jgi:hypothetical protein